MPGKGYVIRKDVKEQILGRLKNEGIPVSVLAEEHGIHPSTIYNWLGGQSTGSNALELARLRRENQVLKTLIGHITLQMEGVKKKKTR
jgi:transposase-like protein